MKKFSIYIILLLSSCTWNFSPSYWHKSQKNFHRINADNQVYYEWIRHTTYPTTSSEDYCKRIQKIPNRGDLSNYGSITIECRSGLYENHINESKKLLKGR